MTWNGYAFVFGDVFEISEKDKAILRNLIKKYTFIATSDENLKRKELWRKNNMMQSGKPPIAVYFEGWFEVPEVSNLQCETDSGKQVEFELRQLIWEYENISDDSPLDNVLHVSQVVDYTGWGIDVKREQSPDAHGSWGFVPVIHSMEDVEKIVYPTITHNTEASKRKLEAVNEAFGDLIPIELSGHKNFGFHLGAMYSDWRGLNELLVDFYDEPEIMNAILDKLTEGHMHIMKQLEEQDLFSLNNDATYTGSGGYGYTDELPAKDFAGKVRKKDLWCSAEDQELAQVSPEFHREYFFNRVNKLLEGFAFNEYGCCEPLHNKAKDVLALPNIRKVSTSPWADTAVMAKEVGNKAIISWKPNPAILAEGYNEDSIYELMCKGIRDLKGLTFEILLQDLRTCAGHTERMSRWCEITRKAIDDVFAE